MRYLLDTDIIIDYLRGYQPTIEKLDLLLKSDDDLYISAVTNLELHVGKSITQDATLEKIDELVSQLSVVDINFEVAGLAGDFRRIYQTPVPDALIAASAYFIQATLVTRNLKHFEPIQEIQSADI